MKRIIGIDPGKEGAIVMLDNSKDPSKLCDIIASQKIPYHENRVDITELQRVLRTLKFTHYESDIVVYIESRATFGIKSPAYDYNYGRLEAACELLFDVKYAPIKTWQSEFCAGIQPVTKKTFDVKERVQITCLKTFGLVQCEDYLYNSKGNFNNNFADAAGIAYYGWLIEEQKERVMSKVVSENGKPKQRSSK